LGGCRIYTRVSTDDQAKEGYSLAAQEQLCRERADQDGNVVSDLYCDDGYSGATLERPQLQRLLENLCRGDVVYVYRLDRLSRDVEHMAILLRLFRSRSVTIRPIVGSADITTSLGRAFTSMQSVWAQLEREQLGERTAMGMAKRITSGKRFGRPPYGYSSETHEWVIDDEKAEVVREIVRMRLAGAGCATICKRLAERGVSGPTSPLWHSRLIWHMLHNPAYVGDIEFGRLSLPNSMPAIIDRDTWNRLQSLNEARQNARSRSESPYLLSGLVFCECGRTMGGYVARPYRRKDGTYAELQTYCCVGRRAQPGTDHVNSVTASNLERLVLSRLESFTDTDHLVLQLPPPRLKPSVNQRLKALGEELESLERALLAGRITGERFDLHKARLERERAEVTAQVAVTVDERERRLMMARGIHAMMKDLAQRYATDGATPEIKASVQTIVERIDISRPDGTRRGLDSRHVRILLRQID